VKKIVSILFALVLVVSLGLAMASPVLAGTIRHVPSVYPTIQAALNASEDGAILSWWRWGNTMPS